jgi:hypothetical protein
MKICLRKTKNKLEKETNGIYIKCYGMLIKNYETTIMYLKSENH